MHFGTYKMIIWVSILVLFFLSTDPEHSLTYVMETPLINLVLEDELLQCPLCDFSCSNRCSHWKPINFHLFVSKHSSSHVLVDADSGAERSTVLCGEECSLNYR